MRGRYKADGWEGPRHREPTPVVINPRGFAARETTNNPVWVHKSVPDGISIVGSRANVFPATLPHASQGSVYGRPITLSSYTQGPEAHPMDLTAVG